MMKQSDQLRRIHSIFGDKPDSSKVVRVTDSNYSEYAANKCGVHRKRLNSVESNISDYSGKVNNNNNNCNNNNNNNNRSKRESFNATKKSHLGKSDLLLGRRQSFTEGYSGSGGGGSVVDLTRADRNRKRNSWNASMFRSIEHPSAFPSLLRSDTTTVNRNNELTLNDARNNKVNLVRRSSMSALNGNNNKPKIVNMNKRQSFGSNLYLRADSSGNLNLVRRDSLGTKNLISSLTGFKRGESAPRDYVSENINATAPKIYIEKASILRKSSIDDGTNNKNKLTKENLHRHVRISESDYMGRKSQDSIDFKLRRMSMDSLDLRRSSMDLAENAFSELSLNSKIPLCNEISHGSQNGSFRDYYNLQSRLLQSRSKNISGLNSSICRCKSSLSKSLEEIGSDISFNYKNRKCKAHCVNNAYNQGGKRGSMSNLNHKRHSVDNLLNVGSHYGSPYQV